MNFTFYVLLLSLIGSYWYIFRFDKSSIRITLEELKVYKKMIWAATSIFIVGVISSFFIEMKIVDIFYFISLSISLYSDYYVFRRFFPARKAS